jgi:hypothetical protein
MFVNKDNMDFKKQRRLKQWKKNKYTNKLSNILPNLCDDTINVVLSFLGTNIVQLKNMYKLQFYKNLTYSVEGACKKIKMKLIHFIKKFSVYEIIPFGQFCLQHNLLEKYKSYTCYKGETDYDVCLMSISILIEKHTEMKQKQMKCSVFHSFVEAFQRQMVKLLCNDNYEITKKEACIIQEYIINLNTDYLLQN